MIRILVIDPDRSVRNILKEMLEYEGYRVDTVQSHPEGVALSEKVSYNVVIIDRVCVPNIPIEEAYFLGRIPVIVLSRNAMIEEAVTAIRLGAIDYIAKPLDMNRLFSSIKEAVNNNSDSGSTLPAPVVKVRRKASKVDPIVGESKQIAYVKRLIDMVAPSDARVLILGANGTGKELVARWLHEKSSRASGPFVEVNCAAIPSELIESELFGHEKGAFTSAIKQRKGKFEQAEQGTLFMDEIGDMSLAAQAKVLRVLQEHKISRVGSDRDIDVDVRVVAATNKDLQNEIAKGNFREDLYHRLSVIVIKVPALCDRADDIPLLIDHFTAQICNEYGIPPKNLDKEAIIELKKMGWRGNIRELRNVIERLIILSGNQITLEDIKLYV